LRRPPLLPTRDSVSFADGWLPYLRAAPRPAFLCRDSCEGMGWELCIGT
jgi:hypothetical protein